MMNMGSFAGGGGFGDGFGQEEDPVIAAKKKKRYEEMFPRTGQSFYENYLLGQPSYQPGYVSDQGEVIGPTLGGTPVKGHQGGEPGGAFYRNAVPPQTGRPGTQRMSTFINRGPYTGRKPEFAYYRGPGGDVEQWDAVTGEPTGNMMNPAGTGRQVGQAPSHVFQGGTHLFGPGGPGVAGQGQDQGQGQGAGLFNIGAMTRGGGQGIGGGVPFSGVSPGPGMGQSLAGPSGAGVGPSGDSVGPRGAGAGGSGASGGGSAPSRDGGGSSSESRRRSSGAGRGRSRR